MKKMHMLVNVAAVLLAITVAPRTNATIISVSGPNSSQGVAPLIRNAPSEVFPLTQGGNTTNFGQQGFDEAQDIVLTSDLDVDGTLDILAGTVVSSHMVFFNRFGTGSITHNNVVWTFDGAVLGVMSDINGVAETASSYSAPGVHYLGNPNTSYPTNPYGNRGLEGADVYWISGGGSSLTVSIGVNQPGDWIRVITASPIPEPSTGILVLAGLVGIASHRRRDASG